MLNKSFRENKLELKDNRVYYTKCIIYSGVRLIGYFNRQDQIKSMHEFSPINGIEVAYTNFNNNTNSNSSEKPVNAKLPENNNGLAKIIRRGNEIQVNEAKEQLENATKRTYTVEIRPKFQREDANKLQNFFLRIAEVLTTIDELEVTLPESSLSEIQHSCNTINQHKV
jgi:hypothetical protein